LRIAFNLGSFPVVTKEALNLLGFRVGEPILPNARCTEANRAKLRDVLVEVGALKGDS
jgi:4-hydroxy-tetrahydrodipicolinate synthase